MDVAITSLRESLFFSVGCAVAGLAGAVLLHVPFTDAFGLVLLVVGAGMMLVGGAMGFVTPGNAKFMNDMLSVFTGRSRKSGTYDYKKTMHSAALFSMTGVLLFAYSLLLGLALG